MDEKLFATTFSLYALTLSPGRMSDDLLWAVKNGDIEQVQAGLATTDVNNELKNGRMALHYAADFGHVDVIELLVQSGADVNLPDRHGITPVLAAIWEGHVDCVKLLLEKGANKSGTAPDGQSYLDCAESDEMKAVLK